MRTRRRSLILWSAVFSLILGLLAVFLDSGMVAGIAAVSAVLAVPSILKQ